MANGNGAPPPPGAKPPMKKSTRNWLLIGGLGAAGLVIWYVMRAKSQSSSQSTTAADQAAMGIDPATGVPYSQEYGGYGASGTTPSLYGYVDPTTGQFISGVGAGSSVLAPSTNASWAQQVEAYLQNLGYDPLAVGAAIGKYLTGQTLTSDQQGIVAAALGFFGQPPQGAPPISTTPPAGNTGGTGSGGGGTTGHTKVLTVGKNETLAQFAKSRNWTAATLAAVEKLNNLVASSRLRKGQKITRPIGLVPPTGSPQEVLGGTESGKRIV